MAGHVAGFMRKRGVVACGAVERRNRRHVDVVFGGVVVGLRLVAGANVRAGRGEKGLKGRVGLGAKVAGRLGGGAVVLGGQAVDLLGVSRLLKNSALDAVFGT